jgi:hypothetical protein
MSDENLLTNHLLRSGITPSFAFPLDVAEFRGEGGVTNYGVFKSKVWPKMGTDLKMALSTYSPGKILTVDGEDYKVEGLYIYGAEDSVNRARSHFSEKIDKNKKLRYYNRCRANYCGWVSKDMDSSSDLSECPVCGVREIPIGGEILPAIKTDIWYRPDGFAPRIVPWKGDECLDTSDSWWYKMAPKPVSKKETIDAFGGVDFPSPLTDEDETELRDYDFENIISTENLDRASEKILKGVFDRINLRSTKDNGEGVELVLINSGYRGSGYYICTDCGAIELRKDLFDQPLYDGSTMRGHHRPYAAISDGTEDSEAQYKKLCKGNAFEEGEFDTVYLGMTFWTDMLIISIPGKRPISAGSETVSNIELDRGLKSLKEALITEIQKSAKLVNREIKGGIRKRSTYEEIDGEIEQTYYYDIYLYDDVSGGAGLSSSILTRDNAWSNFLKILLSTEKRLSGKKCLGGIGCDRACLGCLLDFRNKNEHSVFDRKQGLRIIRYILYGEVPSIESGEPRDSEEYLDIIRNSINQNLERMKENDPVKVDVDNGCIVTEKNGRKLFIRPVISFTELTQDRVIAEWRKSKERPLQFGENLSFSSNIVYSYLDLEDISKRPIWLSENIHRLLNPGSL